MTFEESTTHDSLCTIYLCFVAAHLDQSLVENGVTDEDTRQKVIGSFLSSHGEFLDSEWFKHEEEAYKPALFFGKVEIDKLPTDGMSTNYYSSMSQGIVPPDDFGTCLHEYAFGTVDWLFDLMGKSEQEQLEALFTGTIHEAP